ncbi:MAG TPA: NADH-quinone oxidoreductase subunit C [Burkholderiales bacterium]|nr:NADH-quinone oxidoreductase subunit C [Burkholderiales bacterium]
MNWTRSAVDREAWEQACVRLRSAEASLLGLWAEPGYAHMALMQSHTCEVVTLACEGNRFPSVGRLHSPAIRLERAIRDLVGLEAEGSPDTRPWLHHRGAYPFLPAEGESLHQIPVGPVHAGIIEPGHFRFTANGETVVRLEARLGYAHKGIDALMAGASIERAARLAGRVSGDSTVAYALAFAQALEAALGVEVPRRAAWLRALAAELERLANHFGDIGAVCNDAAFAMMHAQCGLLREQVLRVAHACFGHRLMMDCVVPGGMRCDLPNDGEQRLLALLADVRRLFPELVELYEDTASLKDRTVGTGILSRELARQFAAGGYVGRASGRSFDARRTPGYAPYDQLQFEVPVVEAGDVNARLWIRIREVEQSVGLIEQILDRLSPGEVCIPWCKEQAGEGLALVEGFRGDILAWVRTRPDGKIDRCHLRDPSWFQWPLLEAAIEGNIVADFPLCNKSFNCSYSGHDL